MMITKNGVCYDFSVSQYRFTIDGLTFVFSSRLHVTKFKEKLRENREKINASLSNRFGFPVNVSQLADVVLYRRIEKRGFLIVTSEGKEIWHENIKCDGLTLTAQSLNAR